MTYKHILMAYAATTLFAMPAMAQESTITGNIGLTTDYIFRGYSQTDESAALQGGMDYNDASGLHIGAWASNIDFNNPDDGSLELDVYAGFANVIGAFSYDVGGIYYAYPGSDSNLDYDYVEAYINGGYDFGVASVTVGANYSPDFFGGTGDSLYYYVGANVPLPHEFAVTAHLGQQDIDEANDYTHWSLGIDRPWLGFNWAATYHDTDVDNDDNADARVVLSVSKDF